MDNFTFLTFTLLFLNSLILRLFVILGALYCVTEKRGKKYDRAKNGYLCLLSNKIYCYTFSCLIIQYFGAPYLEKTQSSTAFTVNNIADDILKKRKERSKARRSLVQISTPQYDYPESTSWTKRDKFSAVD
jgi:hypothetical protein